MNEIARQIVLDTETTGLTPEEGHRIIEIGCVEIINRRLTGKHYHQYLQPDRDIDAGAMEVHGITNEFLQEKPHFKDIVQSFLEFIKGAELIIHNAPFDVGFLNHELRIIDPECPTLEHYCSVTDTLAMARKMHPGQRNSLDALCKRYAIDNSQRTLHGALLDAEILADLYLTMTGGQVALQLDKDDSSVNNKKRQQQQRIQDGLRLTVQHATSEELAEHDAVLENIRKSSGVCVWGELLD
ncbi:MAG: DNA polymerase III subunit epsilon [Gammaproteobacteria bacterium]|nr:DNA polymerase III subunit epsilon [Gammaproteobacteria bacterium]